MFMLHKDVHKIVYHAFKDYVVLVVVHIYITFSISGTWDRHLPQKDQPFPMRSVIPMLLASLFLAKILAQPPG